MVVARKSSRYGHRDATMILIGYRHGLRASELCALQWSQVELAAATPWRTPATTHGRYRLGSATRTFSTRCATPSLRRIDLRTSGDNRRSRGLRVLPTGQQRALPRL